MTDDEARDRLFSIIRSVLDDETLALSMATTAQDVPGWDSLKQIMIIVEIEERLGVRLSSREIDAAQCVGDLVALVVRKTV
jgi:acyl carrier protein